MNKLRQYFTSPRKATRDISQIICLTLLLASVFTLINPNFIGKYNLVSIGQNLAPYALLTLGVMMPIAMGGTDLSVGANAISAAVIAGTLYTHGMPLVFVIPVMIFCGSLIGFINGIFVAVYDIQPFIVTLSTMMFARGISAIFAGAPTIYYPSDCWYNYLFSNFNGFPISFVWIAVFTAAAFFMYRCTKLGRYMTSIGCNEKSARIAGVDVVKIKIIGYTLSGLMAGIAGIFWSASFITISAATGNGMELDAVAAVYIGGTAASGGFVNVIGGIIGSIMLVVIRSGLNFALARLDIQINSTYVTFVLSGIIVIMSVLTERVKSKAENRKKSADSQKRSFIVRMVCLVLSVLMAVFLVASALSTGNSNKSGGIVPEKRVCLLTKSEGAYFWRTITAGAVDAGKKYGYEVICRGTESEDPSYLPKQMEIATSLISGNPAGLGVAMIGNGSVDFLKTAYEKGIPVVEYDSGLYAEDREVIFASDSNPIFSYIKADNYKNAQVAAERSFEAVRDDIVESEEYIVGIVQHEVNACGASRAEGFADRFIELAEADPETIGKCVIYTEAKTSEKDNAYKAALEYLYEKGDLRLVFGTSEVSVNQFADAVQSSGDKYDGIKFAAYDVGPKAIEWIKSDSDAQLIGAVDQDPYMIGYITAESLIKKAMGEEVESEIVVPGVWYDKTNIDSFRLLN